MNRHLTLAAFLCGSAQAVSTGIDAKSPGDVVWKAEYSDANMKVGNCYALMNAHANCYFLRHNPMAKGG